MNKRSLIRSKHPQALLASLEKNLKPRSSHVVSLNTSYRSTAQITDFMKALLPDGATINSFTRDGKLPQIIASPDQANGLISLKSLTSTAHDK